MPASTRIAMSPASPFLSIHLRNVMADDLPALFEHQLDPVANQMAMVTPRSLPAFQEHWAKILNNLQNIPQAILMDGMLVGYISCFPIGGQPHVGYWIAREHWGRGIATKALALLLARVRTRPLYACAARTNAASIRVLTRNGFVITGYQAIPADDRHPAGEEALLRLD
jgi:RimJ/RimL family protein N-acetyltransferase